MAFVEFRDVTKVYRSGSVEVHAADGVSFDIEEGEFVVIVGPSGAGKTTVLNMLGGMDSPSSGSISLAGNEISQLDEKALTEYRRADVGFVFQFYNLVQNLTALENVELACQLSSQSLSPVKVLEAVGLKDRMSQFPSQLSGGEQQRVAIARALAKNPQLLLCDEPAGALDYQTGKAVLALLKDQCEQMNKTVVVITHNQAFAPLADRVIHIREGRVAATEINERPLDVESLEY